MATLVAIDTTLETVKPADPCSRVPCTATIRVDSVLGYGQAFARPLAAGDELRVKFAFTLRPSKEQFPDMTESYPGLTRGARFMADVKSVATPGMDSSGGVAFLVYGYEVRGADKQ